MSAVAHWAGVTIGVVSGLLLFGQGLKVFFNAAYSDTWSILVGIVSYFILLPLSIFGIFKPRAAARAITGTLLLLLLGLMIHTIQYIHEGDFSLSEFGLLFLHLILPPGSVAALLFYGSRRDTTAVNGGVPTSNQHRLKPRLEMIRLGGRRKQAQWAAVLLGLVVGVWRLPSAVSLLERFVRTDEWLGAVGVTASVLIVLPLSILAIFKPRAAAYAFLLSLVVALAYPVTVYSPPRFGWTETLSGMLLYLLLDLPLALVAGLLFYATSGQNQTLE